MSEHGDYLQLVPYVLFSSHGIRITSVRAEAWNRSRLDICLSTVLTGSTLGVLLGGVVGDWSCISTRPKMVCSATTAFGRACFSWPHKPTRPWKRRTPRALQHVASMHAPIWWSFTAEVSGVHLGSIFGFMNGAGAIPRDGLARRFWHRALYFSTKAMWAGKPPTPAFWLYFFVILGVALIMGAWILVKCEARGSIPLPKSLKSENSLMK